MAPYQVSIRKLFLPDNWFVCITEFPKKKFRSNPYFTFFGVSFLFPRFPIRPRFLFWRNIFNGIFLTEMSVLWKVSIFDEVSIFDGYFYVWRKLIFFDRNFYFWRNFRSFVGNLYSAKFAANFIFFDRIIIVMVILIIFPFLGKLSNLDIHPL